MSLLFDWYESPGSQDNSEGEKKLYPRVCLRHRCSTDDLISDIESMTTASRGDILLVLSALSHVVGWRLRQGNQVHIDGLGYLNVTLTTDEPVYESTKYKKLKVRISGIKFLPDREMKRSLGNVDVERLEARHSLKLTAEEIDARLEAHFAEQPYLTRSKFGDICGLTKATANRYIRQLIADGKLLRDGTQYHPIYVPAPGFYGAAAIETEPTTEPTETETGQSITNYNKQ